MHRVGRDARRYGPAVLAALVSLFLRETLYAFVRKESSLPHSLDGCRLFRLWYCGVAPSVVSTLLSFAGVWSRFDYLLLK